VGETAKITHDDREGKEAQSGGTHHLAVRGEKLEKVVETRRTAPKRKRIGLQHQRKKKHCELGAAHSTSLGVSTGDRKNRSPLAHGRPEVEREKKLKEEKRRYSNMTGQRAEQRKRKAIALMTSFREGRKIITSMDFRKKMLGKGTSQNWT